MPRWKQVRHRNIAAKRKKGKLVQFGLLYNRFAAFPLLYPSSMSSGLQHHPWSDVPAEALNPLLTRQFVTGSQAMLARIELKKGCVVPRHAHANEQISYITSGALRFTLGEEGASEERIVRAGEVLVIPGGLPHAAEALEDTTDFDVFAPPRQDWIEGSDAYLR